MSHSSSRRSADSGNEGHGRLVLRVVMLEKLGGVLLSGPTDLTDHDDTIGGVVLQEDLSLCKNMHEYSKVIDNSLSKYQ